MPTRARAYDINKIQSWRAGFFTSYALIVSTAHIGHLNA